LPQTPFQRVCASPASDPQRIAELRRQQQELDPFELSRKIQAKLERIFQFSKDLAPREKLSCLRNDSNDRELLETKKPRKDKQEKQIQQSSRRPATSKGELRVTRR
jgi:hypothetical protein